MINFKKLGFFSIATAGFFAAEKLKKELHTEQDILLNATQINADKETLKLNSFQRSQFPWELNFASLEEPANWEMRKVTIRGSLYGNYHLVYRKRNGKDGYLIFKGLKTANGLGSTQSPMNPAAKAYPIGMLVGLGWISAENVFQLPTLEINYISKIEPDTSLPGLLPQIRNISTGFVYNTEADDLEYPIEEFNEEEVELTGFLRKGEQPNRLLGKHHFWKNQLTTYIDLDRLAAYYSFDNVWSARNYYLEVAVPEPRDDVLVENLLAPTSLEIPAPVFKEYENSRLMSQFAFWQYACGAGMFLTLVV